MARGTTVVAPDDTELQSAIPVVDVSQAEETAAAAVYHACTTTGFFMCSGHDVPQQLLDALFEQLRALFALPEDVKLSMLADENNRGCVSPRCAAKTHSHSLRRCLQLCRTPAHTRRPARDEAIFRG